MDVWNKENPRDCCWRWLWGINNPDLQRRHSWFLEQALPTGVV
jgi:hypothetical protein